MQQWRTVTEFDTWKWGAALVILKHVALRLGSSRQKLEGLWRKPEGQGEHHCWGSLERQGENWFCGLETHDFCVVEGSLTTP